jgi:hypothetical protein
MKKKMLIFVLILFPIITPISYAEQKKSLEERVVELESKISILQDEISSMESSINFTITNEIRRATSECQRYAFKQDEIL